MDRLLVLKVYAKARGVTGRAVLAYALVWVLVAAASRFSISAIGLQFGPPGAATLDTVAMLLMLVPAAVVGRCLTSRALNLEATRSRPRQPSQLLWTAALATGAAASPALVWPLLHWSIDPSAFVANWWFVLGLGLLLGTLVATPVAATGSFVVLAVFTTPGFVPWSANVIYNVELKAWSAGLGAGLLLAGALLSSVRESALLTRQPSA